MSQYDPNNPYDQGEDAPNPYDQQGDASPYDLGEGAAQDGPPEPIGYQDPAYSAPPEIGAGRPQHFPKPDDAYDM